MEVQRIALIEVEDASAQLLRLHLEHLGLAVALNRPGKPSDFFSCFSFFGHAADMAIICAHGDERGIVFSEMADGVDDLVLPDNRIPADLVARNLTQSPQLIVSTACATGTNEFAEAFLKSGANSYLAPEGDPLGRDIPLFLATLMYALPVGLHAALERANNAVASESRFRLFSA